MTSTALLLGSAAFFLFLTRRGSSAPDTQTPERVKQGLSITETEALGWIQANKLAYPSLSVLPESVVMATIAVESNFDPNATAPAGERGVMQVIYPSTWNDVIRRARLSTDLDAFVPKDNILVGMHYLRLVRAEFLKDGVITGDGSAAEWALIDQGYNLGPAGVKQGKRNQPRIGKFLLALETFQRAGLP